MGRTGYERLRSAAHPSGDADAEALGRMIAAQGHVPDLVMCSTALRARQTWAQVARSLGKEDVRTIYSDVLYQADAAGHLTMIRKAPDTKSLLVVGHNPIMEDLALGLSGDGKPEAMKRVAAGFPACGLAILSFQEPLGAIAPGKGFLETFLAPGRL